MTKSLTEKWKDGEIKEGFYYVRFHTGEIVYRHLSGNKPDKEFVELGYFQEVIAPVPSYDEHKEMDSELKELACKNDSLAMECGKLQEQLKEANEVIKKYMSVVFEIRSEEEKPTVLQLAFDYLKKWGVK